MDDHDILRHDRLDRLDHASTFGSDNHTDLPAGCEALTRFTNLATLSGKLGRHKVGQLRGPTSVQTLLEASQEVTRLDAMMQNLYRRHPAKLHAWLAASRVRTQPTTQRGCRNSRRHHHSHLIGP